MNDHKAVLQTLAYFDIFDYPLTFEELRFYSPAKTTKKSLQEQLRKIKTIKKRENLYFLKYNDSIFRIRKDREKFSKKKLIIAKKIISVISKIPTVRFIGISGALAMQNCKENDDIDLFVITRRGTIWSTRLIALIILGILRVRRKRLDKNATDKMCLNMILDEGSLELSKRRQNMYGSHEVIQMLPMFERKNTYNRFIVANSWIFNFLPNAKPKKVLKSSKGNVFSLLVYIIEPFARRFQKMYMGKITKEEVSDTVLAFHPVDYQSKILTNYKKRLKALV